MHGFYGNIGGRYLRKRNGFAQRYQASLSGEWLRGKADGQSFDASWVEAAVEPDWSVERGRWLAQLRVPVSLRIYTGQGECVGLFHTRLYVRRQTGYRWKLSLTAEAGRTVEGGLSFCPVPYRTDYRTTRNPNGLLPRSIRYAGTLHAEYKRTVQEFFATALCSYSLTESDVLVEQYVAADSVAYTRRHPHRSGQWLVQFHLSKGFYKWGLKTSLQLQVLGQRGKQWVTAAGHEADAADVQTYRYTGLTATPKLDWAPRFAPVELGWRMTLRYGGTRVDDGTRLTPLLHLSQQADLTARAGRVQATFSLEHCRNDLGNHRHMDVVLADLAALYRQGRLRVEARLNNLFNKRAYTYTLHTAATASTTRLDMRGREAVVRVMIGF